MQYVTALGVLLSSVLHQVCASSAGGKGSVTPVMQVINMLSDLKTKGEKEKHDEQVAFSAFKEFCEHTSAEKERLITEAENEIQRLTAEIGKAEADVATLSDDIESLEADIAKWTAEAQQAQSLRDKEYGEYAATYQDYTDSIDALERAIQVLKAKSADVPQAEPELIEVRRKTLQRAIAAKKLPSDARRALQSFLQQGAGADAMAPEANAYEFQSTSIVDMLEKLRLRFQDELKAVETEEMNRKHAFELVMEKLTDDTKYAEDQKAEKTVMKAQRAKDAADGKEMLAETTAAKEADETYLRNLIANCQSKSQEFEKRQALRQGELEAIQKAIEIISSPDVAGAAEAHLPTLLQESRKLALVQVGRASGASASVTVAPAQTRLAAYLKSQAAKTGSPFLSSLAQRVTEDPFAKVKKMIKDLLVKLLEQANQEADHKAWCDSELAENKKTRDDLSAEVESLTSTVDELTASIAKLTEEIPAIADAIKQIDAAVATATVDRQEEKATNEATIADAKTAQTAVQSALTMLKEFYATAAESTALLQRKRGRQDPVTDSPSTWDSAYTGMQGGKDGILGMLEVVQSDFARLEADTSTSEAEAAREFLQFTDDSAVDKAVKDKEMRHKQYKKDGDERFKREYQKTLEATQKELTAALDYYDKLKPDCIDTGLSYERRVQAREEELQSLKEALRILNGEDLVGR